MKNIFFYLIFLLIVLPTSCKKGGNDPIDDKPDEETPIIGSENAVFIPMSGTPGDIIQVKASFKGAKSLWTGTLGDKSMQLSRLNDSIAYFMVPVVSPGKVSLNLSEAGLKESTFTVDTYQAITDPTPAVSSFSNTLETLITSLHEEDATLKTNMNLLMEAFHKKYSELPANEKIALAYCLNGITKNLQAGPQAASNKLLSASSSASLQGRLLKSSSFAWLDVPGSIESQAEYREAILASGALLVFSLSTLVVGAELFAAPTGWTQVGGLALVASSLYSFSKFLKYKSVMFRYNGKAITIFMPSASNKVRLMSTTTSNSAELTFIQDTLYALRPTVGYETLTTADKNGNNTVFSRLISRMEEAGSLYNKGIDFLNGVSSWFSAKPSLTKFTLGLPASSPVQNRPSPGSLLSVEAVSDSRINIQVTPLDDGISVKASSTEVDTIVPVTFRLAYKEPDLGIDIHTVVDAIYDGRPRPHQLDKVSGDKQTATPGQKLKEPLKIKVTDKNGKILAGVDVEWKIKSGGGSLSNTEGKTNAQGIATAEWTPGSTGDQEVSVLVNTIAGTPVRNAPLVFTAQGATIIGKWKATELYHNWYDGDIDVSGKQMLGYHVAYTRESTKHDCTDRDKIEERTDAYELEFKENNTANFREKGFYRYQTACSTVPPIEENYDDTTSSTYTLRPDNVLVIDIEGDEMNFKILKLTSDELIIETFQGDYMKLVLKRN